jgi:hypothetical protein
MSAAKPCERIIVNKSRNAMRMRIGFPPRPPREPSPSQLSPRRNSTPPAAISGMRRALRWVVDARLPPSKI